MAPALLDSYTSLELLNLPWPVYSVAFLMLFSAIMLHWLHGLESDLKRLERRARDLAEENRRLRGFRRYRRARLIR